MKKSILLIVLLLVVSITLFACTSNETGNVGDGSNETESTPPMVEDKPSEDTPSDGEDAKPEDTKPEEIPPPSEDDKVPLLPLTKYETIVVANTKRANLRESNTTKSRILGTLNMGEGLAVADIMSNGWYKVHYKSKYAYISGSLVKTVHLKMSNNDAIERVVLEGKKMLGYPYVWGSQRYHWGNGKLNSAFEMGKFDCSALMQYIYHKGAGININVNTRTQVLDGRVVRDEIRRGDLMFFTNAYRRYKSGIDKVGHVAMYLGDNYILHTASTYALIEEISASRWRDYLVSKRFF